MRLSFTIFLLSALFFAIGFTASQPIIATISAVILFTAFDVMGYYYITTKEETPNSSRNESRLVVYRIAQTLFQLCIAVALWKFASIISAICFMLAWWFFVCDCLYYVILRQNFLKFDNVFWAWWTPLGIYRKFTKSTKLITGKECLAQAIIGTVIVAALLYFV